MHIATQTAAVLILAVALLQSHRAEAFLNILPPPPAGECVGPADGGLAPVVSNVVGMLPTIPILEILMEALSNDDEVVRALAYLQDYEFGRIVYDVAQMDGWQYVIGVFCDELGFHMRYYLRTVGYLFSVRPQPPMFEAQTADMAAERRSGLVGLLKDVAEQVPHEEIAAYLLAEYESNESVRRTVELIRGPEFRSVAEAIEMLPEFAGLKEHFGQFGFDVECLICRAKMHLGWLEENDDCDGCAPLVG